jgi:hypothetical protein
MAINFISWNRLFAVAMVLLDFAAFFQEPGRAWKIEEKTSKYFYIAGRGRFALAEKLIDGRKVS